ncbi:MAG: DUF4040 domain-containing protein [Oscillospiraceae bacterium]|nr:DUF4040 domain-containing protein [Oscillospiraceae bacterium]
METFRVILLLILIACAICVSLTKRLLTAVIIFMGYSLIMAVVWILLESPDLGITEAAVGAGVSGILLLVTLKKINRTETDSEDLDTVSDERAGDGDEDR